MDLPTPSTAFNDVSRAASNIVPLDQLATEIREKLVISNDALISAGRLLLQARQRVEAGEAGDPDFPAWVAANVQKDMREVNRLIRMVEDRSDEEALAAADRRRQQKRDHERRKREAAKAAVVHGPPSPPSEVWSEQADKVTNGPLDPPSGGGPLERAKRDFGALSDEHRAEFGRWFIKALSAEHRSEFGRWFRQTYPEELETVETAADGGPIETRAASSTGALASPGGTDASTEPARMEPETVETAGDGGPIEMSATSPTGALTPPVGTDVATECAQVEPAAAVSPSKHPARQKIKKPPRTFIDTMPGDDGGLSAIGAEAEWSERTWAAVRDWVVDGCCRDFPYIREARNSFDRLIRGTNSAQQQIFIEKVNSYLKAHSVAER
jgi:hypothetical protein